jgi:hypothetical protein
MHGSRFLLDKNGEARKGLERIITHNGAHDGTHGAAQNTPRASTGFSQ